MPTLHIITLFPALFPGPLGESVLGRALANGIWQLQTHLLRDFATDKHRTVDDSPYGGGAGMVLKADVLDAALNHVLTLSPRARCFYLSPRGTLLTQRFAHQLAEQLVERDLILLCGRFEGVDERFLQARDIEEISIGDYVLTGGDVAAMVLAESCVRLLPGVLGEEASVDEESFGINSDYAGLLEYPHYTKPPSWNGLDVPAVLLSGHHRNISQWRKEQAQELTRKRRPDLWKCYSDDKNEG